LTGAIPAFARTSLLETLMLGIVVEGDAGGAAGAFAENAPTMEFESLRPDTFQGREFRPSPLRNCVWENRSLEEFIGLA